MSSPATQSEEIEEVKHQFPACKVISNVGDFAYLVELKKHDEDLTLKFQLEGTYPESVPDVIVKSGQLTTDHKISLTEYLQKRGEELKGQKMLIPLFDSALQWAADNDITLTVASVVGGGNKAQAKGHKVNTKGKKGGSKSKGQEEHVRGSKKLTSMKTSEDVISRILWDESLPSEHFSIGYLDRFVGVVERAFSTFTWEDIASVDYDALAIPKHRIHYFKYKGVVVWDKNQRLDNVFGSAGSETTITDVIAKYEAGELVVDDKAESHDVESDDEDIVISTGLEEDSGDVVYPRDKYWGPKKRPTHFLCLRVTDPGVVAAVEAAEKDIVGLEPLYADGLIPPDRLHITLACLGLDSVEEVDKASQVLHRLAPQLSALNPTDMRVKLDGVDNFFNNVLYARVEYNPGFLAFVHKLRLLVQEAGLEIRDVFEFTPHMTILKLKRDLQKEMKTRYIEPRVYKSLKGVCFGEQVVDNIYLCEMSENRDEVGFYITPTQLKL